MKRKKKEVFLAKKMYRKYRFLRQLHKSKDWDSAEKMKTAFLHNMSHEIRTPLNAIVGFMQLLETDVTLEEHALFLKIIHQNSELLMRIIDDMLTLAALECGEYRTEPIEFDVSSLMHDLSESLHGYIHEGVELKVNVHESQYVRLDLNSLRRVLKGLIINADKFTPQGSITVDYIIDGDMLNVSVTDTGIGIAAEDQKRIFYKFEKIDQFSQGLGLGLPICKAIVEKLGGRIGVESEPGCGSTFRFRLPLNIHC